MSLLNGSTLHDFRVTNFKCFEDLNLTQLGQVNLVVGRNSVGKSSLLEALYAYRSEDPIDALDSIASLRGESWRPSSRGAAILSLFRTSPRPGSEMLLGPIDDPLRIRLRAFNRRKDEEGYWRYEPAPDSTPSDSLFGQLTTRVLRDASQGIELQFRGEILRRMILDSRYRLRKRTATIGMQGPEQQTECVFVGAGGLPVSILSSLWDLVALSASEDEVVELVRSVFPAVERISMIGRYEGTEATGERRAFVKAVGFSEPVPIQRIGDGVGRILGIAIALVNAKNLLLLDEFENGLHYSIHESVWRFIFEASLRLGVQVFVTTHSLDCIKAFSRVAARSDAVGSLIRLEEKGGKIRAVQVDEKTLEIAERNAVELR
ncbi:MAG: AAA family ATPase [Bryobacteraceae bacterium]|nr:AAA family ATPase [Bryobacteraceae bacterium]